MNVDTSRKVKIALGQLSAGPDMKENLQKAAAQIKEAADGGAELILFPEVGFERFFPKINHDISKFESAEAIPGPISDFLSEKAKENRIVVVASYLEKGFIGEYYDSAVCIDADGTLLGVTRMVHQVESDGYDEKFYYGPGNCSWPVYETAAGAVGISICYDSWFPETVRSLCLRGADIILVPTVEYEVPGLPELDQFGGTEWEIVTTMQKANAVLNGVWIAVSNRVGEEDGIDYLGSSFVVDPWGRIRKMANSSEDEVLICEVDLKETELARQAFPLLRDRRPETYGLLTEGWHSEPYYHGDRVRK